MNRFVLLALLVAGAAAAQGPVAPVAPSLLLESPVAALKVELAGGILSDFHLKGDGVNPLRGLGHFVCLDRWGPPSATEERNGMPFHGEAWKVQWRVPRPPERRSGGVEAEMEAALPLAGLEVRRRLRLSDGAALVVVRETVTNRNRLGRIYNLVQHPTIGPPFLDGETRVDASAGRGFMQSSPLPNPERPEVRWPAALHEGQRVDMRRLTDRHEPNVVSYLVEGEYGWTAATAPEQERLLGYVWPAADYPWFNAWRHVEQGRPAYRGLEFGTTGLHQPFPVLVAKGRIFDRPLYAHLDAGESVTRSYAMFLLRAPRGFEGVQRLRIRSGRLELLEAGRRRRILSLPVGDLFAGDRDA